MKIFPPVVLVKGFCTKNSDILTLSFYLKKFKSYFVKFWNIY